MTAGWVAPRQWPRRRWWIVVAFVFVVQLGLIFGLSDRRVTLPRRPGLVPALHVARGAAADVLALSDPTLFALPHRQGFSGLAWLSIPQPPTSSFDWPEDPRWLQLSVQRLGAAFGRAVEPADPLISLVSLTRPEPALTMAGAGPPPTAQAGSRLLLEDGLATRRLITPLELPPERHTDLLTASVVQVVVDSEGRPVSVPVLLSGSGSTDADNDALRFARTARFNSITSAEAGKFANPLAHLTWGRMIFEWQTLPEPATNAVRTTP
jgi:TonB family protein